MTAIIQSAAYFTVVATRNHTYGFITLASGQSEKRILCRKHAYLQLKRLQDATQVDEFEAAHLRTQIEDSSLPFIVPNEFESYIQQLIESGEDTVHSIFDKDYFHPDVEEFLATESIDPPLSTGSVFASPVPLQ